MTAETHTRRLRQTWAGLLRAAVLGLASSDPQAAVLLAALNGPASNAPTNDAPTAASTPMPTLEGSLR